MAHHSLHKLMVQDLVVLLGSERLTPAFVTPVGSATTNVSVGQTTIILDLSIYLII